MQEPRRFLSANFERGLLLLLQGLFKKIALADNLSPVVNQGFAHAATLGGADAWVAALAFAAQIYCDFSGYTDMGRGSALMLGFDLPDNFNLPYIARSLTDFWKRWHISLSSWLRDYLYIPLGGSKCSLVRRHANLLITMVLGGLWHGASWHFVVWGAFHGTGLILCHSYDHWLKNSSSTVTGFLRQLHSTATGGVLSMLLTFVFVLVGWVFFRAETMAEALNVLHGMFAPQAVTSGVLAEVLAQHPIVPALLAYLLYRLVYDYGAAVIKGLPAVAAQICTPRVPARVVVYLAFFVMTMALAPSSASPFIYFAF
jgi:alginate O-acetyltransferase complex protein AlgI